MHAQILKQQRQAAAYVALGLEIIPFAESADDLRAWWNDERQHRDEYGLTDIQTHTLRQACREHVRSLGQPRGASL